MAQRLQAFERAFFVAPSAANTRYLGDEDRGITAGSSHSSNTPALR